MGKRRQRRTRSSAATVDHQNQSAISQVPARQIRNPYPPFEILNTGQIEAIDAAAMQILRDNGLRFQQTESLDILEANGARVDHDTGMVKFDESVIREHIAKAPSKFTLYARNDDKNVIIGENYINFAPVSGPPNISDLDRGRRPVVPRSCTATRCGTPAPSANSGSRMRYR
jgi:trimethylamine--corrinoid protein Co-methyltransferase